MTIETKDPLAEQDVSLNDVTRPRRIFISHDASRDRPIANAFVKLLKLGIGVRHDDIFVTSLKGHGPPVGKPFIESIRAALSGANVVIALLTDNYWESPFCVCELGASWFDATKHLVPILVPPLTYEKDLKGVINLHEALKLDQDRDLDRLNDIILDALRIRGTSAQPGTPIWNDEKESFLRELPAALAASPYVGRPSLEEHARVKKERDEYKEAFSTARRDKKVLEEKVEKLKAAKDAEDVANIEKEYSSTGEQFDDLIEAIRKAMKPIPSIAMKAIYAHAASRTFNPTEEDFKEVERAAEEGYLDDSDGVTLVTEHPEVAASLAAIEKLEKFLDEPPEDFATWYANEYKGKDPKLSLRPFWERHHLL